MTVQEEGMKRATDAVVEGDGGGGTGGGDHGHGGDRLVQQLQDENMALRSLLEQYQQREAAAGGGTTNPGDIPSTTTDLTLTYPSEEAEREQKRIFQESSKKPEDDRDNKDSDLLKSKEKPTAADTSTGSTRTPGTAVDIESPAAAEPESQIRPGAFPGDSKFDEQDPKNNKSKNSSSDSPEDEKEHLVEDKDGGKSKLEDPGNPNTDTDIESPVPAADEDHTHERPNPLPTGTTTIATTTTTTTTTTTITRGIPGAHAHTGGRPPRPRTPPRNTLPSASASATDIESANASSSGERLLLGGDQETQESTNSSMLEPHAIPVVDQEEPIRHQAKPVDTTQRTQQRQNDKRRFFLLFFGGLFLLLVFVGVLGGVLSTTSGTGSSDTGSGDTTDAELDSISIAPSGAPSEAPTDSLDQLLMSLPESTVATINNDSSSPQWKALVWLQNHPELLGMPEWRKVQLFSLGTFFYAMEGPNWREDIRKRWLQYSDECYWFSTGFGQFNFATGAYVENNRYNMDPCNERNEFQLLDLVGLELGGRKPHIPPEISLLTSLELLALTENRINVSLAEFLPSQLYGMSNLTHLNFAQNRFYGEIPSQLGLMTALTELQVNANQLTGQLPTELLTLPNLLKVKLYINYLSGTIPTQVGQLTNARIFMSFANLFSGTVPSEFGALTNMIGASVDTNLLTGTIPTQVGSMSSLVRFWLNSNELTGAIPTQFSSLPNLKFLWLNKNKLTGSVPSELQDMVVNGTLKLMEFHQNNLQGQIPEELCSLGLSEHVFPGSGISFDCSEDLCGCCWCPCSGKISDNCSYAIPVAYSPEKEDEDWPGSFPTPVNSSNVVTINIRMDRFPEETTWEWSRLQSSSDGEIVGATWESLDLKTPLGENSLYSYTKEVESNSTYRLLVSDRSGDGTCCTYGFGWFSITNAIPSTDYGAGTVVWNATGEDFEESLEVFVSVDSLGNAKLLEDSPEM